MTGRVVVSDIGERALFAPAPDVEPALPAVAPAGLAPVDQNTLPATPLVRGSLSKVGLATGSLSRASFAHSLSRAVATEVDRGVGFLLMPVFLALGAMTYFALSSEPGFAPLIGGAVFALVTLIVVPFGRIPHFVLVAILLCFCGMLLAKAETWRAGTKMLGGEISTQVSGHVVALDHLANGRVRLTIDVTATDRPKLRYAPERIRASARKISPGIEVGSHVKGLARLMPPSGPVRPGSYDFSFESYFDRIGAIGFFMRGPELASPGAPPGLNARFSAWVQNSRILIAERIRERIGGAEGEIAAALVVGVRAGIPEDVNEALRRTGLYHIISISGLHMALVAGTIMGASRAVFALFPGFASRRPVKKYAASAALLAIAAYLFISGGQVAAQRSFIMLSVMLTALLFDRAALTMRNLAISAMVVIAVSPHEVVGPSFQMSFAATAALVGAYAWWSEHSHAKPRPQARRSIPATAIRKLAMVAAGLAMTSIVAGLATAAFGAYHFQRVSPLSLLANLAAMPVVSVFVMPFAVLGAIAMPFDLDGPFFDVMGKGLTAMIAIANWFSARSPIDAVGLVSPRAVVLMTVALILATMMTTRLRLVALPFAIMGILMLASARTPDVLVSEDGRLMAVPTRDGHLAVNRSRPNQFTIDNWKRSLQAETLVAPEIISQPAPASDKLSVGRKSIPIGGAARKVSAAAKEPQAAPEKQQGGVDPTGRFVCSAGLCLATHFSGAIIAHAADPAAALRACALASVIVIDDATARIRCEKSVAIVTKRQLAQRGSAAIFFDERGQGETSPTGANAANIIRQVERGRPEIRFALTRHYRPWHTQRQFSRAARGMAPYQRKPRPPPAHSDAKRSAQEAHHSPLVQSR